MLLTELMLNESSNVNTGQWYHVSLNKFGKFDLDAARANRGTNYSGVYMARSIEEIENYVSKPGYLYTLSVNVSKQWQEGESPISDKMVQTYRELLLKHTNYRERWLDSAIIPSFKERKRFEDIEGWIKTQTVVSGGYDHWIDGRDLVVFNPSLITIHDVQQFTPPKQKKHTPAGRVESSNYFKTTDIHELVRYGKDVMFLDSKSVDYLLDAKNITNQKERDAIYAQITDMGITIY